MRKRSTAALALGVLLLTGCSTGPEENESDPEIVPTEPSLSEVENLVELGWSEVLDLVNAEYVEYVKRVCGPGTASLISANVKPSVNIDKVGWVSEVGISNDSGSTCYISIRNALIQGSNSKEAQTQHTLGLGEQAIQEFRGLEEAFPGYNGEQLQFSTLGTGSKGFLPPEMFEVSLEAELTDNGLEYSFEVLSEDPKVGFRDPDFNDFDLLITAFDVDGNNLGTITSEGGRLAEGFKGTGTSQLEQRANQALRNAKTWEVTGFVSDYRDGLVAEQLSSLNPLEYFCSVKLNTNCPDEFSIQGPWMWEEGFIPEGDIQ